ncbi:MAG: CBS domain-containing protein [Candidatus Hodarchaeaceae archaeon]|nr:CBS domain-containing protein [Candidatus Hodarchaeaceae archaeon]
MDQIMSSPVVAVNPTNPISHAKNLMLRHKVKRLVVMDRGNPIGMLSMRDIAERLGKGSSSWRRRPIDNIPIARVMSKGIVAVSTSSDLNKAAALMLKHDISSLIVLDGKKVAGVVTKTDLARAFSENLTGRSKVRDLMSSNPVTVNRRHSLARVVELMQEYGVRRVVVVDGKRPVGIVTESDVAFAQLEQPGAGVKEREVKFTRRLDRASRPRARYIKYVALLTAEDVMRPELLTVEADDDAARAAALMLEHGISGLPVIEGEELVGIITKTDLTKGISRLGV